MPRSDEPNFLLARDPRTMAPRAPRGFVWNGQPIEPEPGETEALNKRVCSFYESVCVALEDHEDFERALGVRAWYYALRCANGIQ